MLEELDRIGNRLLRAESRGYRAFQGRVGSLTEGLDDDSRARVVTVVTRFMRTPSFLVRSVDLSQQISVDDLIAGLERPDLSGTTLAQRVTSFVDDLGRRRRART